jgi:hypothetical protein
MMRAALALIVRIFQCLQELVPAGRHSFRLQYLSRHQLTAYELNDQLSFTFSRLVSKNLMSRIGTDGNRFPAIRENRVWQVQRKFLESRMSKPDNNCLALPGFRSMTCPRHTHVAHRKSSSFATAAQHLPSVEIGTISAAPPMTVSQKVHQLVNEHCPGIATLNTPYGIQTDAFESLAKQFGHTMSFGVYKPHPVVSVVPSRQEFVKQAGVVGGLMPFAVPYVGEVGEIEKLTLAPELGSILEGTGIGTRMPAIVRSAYWIGDTASRFQKTIAYGSFGERFLAVSVRSSGISGAEGRHQSCNKERKNWTGNSEPTWRGGNGA